MGTLSDQLQNFLIKIMASDLIDDLFVYYGKFSCVDESEQELKDR